MTLNAGGQEITQTAYALGLDDSVQPSRRRALSRFSGYLESLAVAHPELLAVRPRPYEPASIDVYAWERDPDDGWNVIGPMLAWPLDRALSALPVSELYPDAGCASIRGADIAAVVRALEVPADADSFTVWRSGKHDWLVAFEANVPGEAACPAGRRSVGDQSQGRDRRGDLSYAPRRRRGGVR